MKTDISITVEWQGGRKGLKTISRVVRSRAGLWIKNHVQERVSKRGMGASGALKGYSKKPIYMETGGVESVGGQTQGRWVLNTQAGTSSTRKRLARLVTSSQ